MKASVIAVVGIFGIAASGVGVAADQVAFGNEWTQVADGVFKKVDQDGTIAVSAFGQSGADYDRAAHSIEISRLKMKVLNEGASADELSQIETLQLELESIPLDVSGIIEPASSTKGMVCDQVFYALDSHFTVGDGGAASLARANWGFTLWGPAPNYPTVNVYSRAKVARTGYPTKTVINSSDVYATALADQQFAIWDGTWPTASSCNGATYSSITVNQGIPGCNAKLPGFASLTKTYPTCVGSL